MSCVLRLQRARRTSRAQLQLAGRGPSCAFCLMCCRRLCLGCLEPWRAAAAGVSGARLGRGAPGVGGARLGRGGRVQQCRAVGVRWVAWRERWQWAINNASRLSYVVRTAAPGAKMQECCLRLHTYASAAPGQDASVLQVARPSLGIVFGNTSYQLSNIFNPVLMSFSGKPAFSTRGASFAAAASRAAMSDASQDQSSDA